VPQSVPQQPLPPPLELGEPGSFAYYTLTQRWPAIAQQVAQERTWPPATVEALEALRQSLPNGSVRALRDRAAPDTADWDGYLAPWLGQPWLALPWYPAECYFYRRILEATGFFLPGATQGLDPFAAPKQAALQAALERWPPGCDGANGRPLQDLLEQALWGNQADLSLQPGKRSAGEAGGGLLQDQREAAIAHLAQRAGGRVEVVADNAGAELLGDLALADALLARELAGEVRFHLKPHPFLVSDATAADARDTLAALEAAADPGLQRWGQRLQGYRRTGQLWLEDDFFWSAPLALGAMPAALAHDLARAELVILKGDANYRRLLGDRHWAFSSDWVHIAGDFPAPLLLLRTLKSEVAAGLDAATIEWVRQRDPEWLTDGQWGIIQFYDPS